MRMGASVASVLLLALPALASAQNDAVRLSGELRLRGEAERTATVDTLDAFTLLRARLGLQADLGSNARVFLQLQDARTLGSEASTSDASADQLDLHQGWLEWGHALGGYDFALRAGRQEISLGNERLVGAVNWSNTGRSFDGVRALLGPDDKSWNLTALAATVRERGRRTVGTQPDGNSRTDHTLLGAYADSKMLDLFAFFDRGAAQRTFTGIDRLTLGGHIDVPAGSPFTAWLEGAYQLGNQLPASLEQQDIRAWFAGGRVAYNLSSTPLRSLGVGLDYLSGDATPQDDEYEAFNTLYHTGHKWYGYLDLFPEPNTRTGDRGLMDGIASTRLQLAGSAPLDIDLHRFWTAVQRTDAEASDLGWELDLTLPLAWGGNRRLQLGYSAFRNGGAMPLLGLGDDGDWWHWGYAMVTFNFSSGVQ